MKTSVRLLGWAESECATADLTVSNEMTEEKGWTVYIQQCTYWFSGKSKVSHHRGFLSFEAARAKFGEQSCHPQCYMFLRDDGTTGHEKVFTGSTLSKEE
jgi:hypothetical protein